MKSNDLIIPVYLNQRIVFDLVAMLQKGIATVTRVAEDRTKSDKKADEIGASFGLNSAFATLLRIDLSGKKETSAESASTTTSSEERVHTPSSLFFELRRMMIEKDILLQDTPDLQPEPGDFIEFSSVLQRNPLVETIDAVLAVYRMGEIWEETPKKSQKGSKPSNPPSRPFERQFKELSELLRSEDTVDLTAEGLECGYGVMTTLETQYLNDPTMADLVDGTYRIIGKVIRSVADGDALNLVRKNAFGIIQGEQREKMIQGLRKLSETQPGIPAPRWDLEGPAIQVIPVAIFA